MAADPSLPNFLIIGAPRSGTTSLARYIGAHSDGFVPREKELRFFDQPRDRGLDWYRQFFADAGDATAVGEATPRYLYSQLALDRISTTMPDVRLIAVLRQPIDRAYSSYWMHRERGREPGSFAEAIADEPRRIEAMRAKAGGAHPHLYNSRYTLHLTRVCEVFPRESIHVLLTDDLERDPVAAFARVCDHLGIDPSERPECLGEPLNRYMHFRSSKVRATGKRIEHPIGRVIERLNVRKLKYPPLDPAFRQRLTAQFDDEIASLEQWLGRDLTMWRA